MPAKYKNILVINLMHIGDLLLTTPIFRTLRSAYPEARIMLLADKKLSDLVAYNPHLDGCLFLDKKGADNNPLAFFRFIRRVRREKFDLVINLHRNERASALAAFSGAKRIVGYAKPFFSWFFADVLPNRNQEIHQVASHFEVLAKTGVVAADKIDDAGIEMTLPPGAAESAEKIWRETFLLNPLSRGEARSASDGSGDADRRRDSSLVGENTAAETAAPPFSVVALNIGASWLTKRYPPEQFAEIADTLIDEGYKIAFFGGPMDEDLVESCLALMRHKESERDADGRPLVVRFTGRVTLGELAALLRRCALMITTDSGPMHVGTAMHVPIVAMFGASPVTGFCPYDGRDVAIKSPVPCHPCQIHECPKKGDGKLACMKFIHPYIVLENARKLLEKYKSFAGRMTPPDRGDYNCGVCEYKLGIFDPKPYGFDNPRNYLK